MITEAGEILLRRGLINREQLQQSRATANGGGILESVIRAGFAKEEDALKVVAEEFGLDFIDLREANVDLTLLQTFPLKLIYRHALFPVKRDRATVRCDEQPTRFVRARRSVGGNGISCCTSGS